MAEEKTKKKTAVAVKKTPSTKNLVKPISSRGRIFKGEVVRKFPRRVAIEFERTVRIPKFERLMKKKTRIHARLPDEMSQEIHVGDLIKVQECRPLSKIIHFVVIGKVTSQDSEESNNG